MGWVGQSHSGPDLGNETLTGYGDIRGRIISLEEQDFILRLAAEVMPSISRYVQRMVALPLIVSSHMVCCDQLVGL